MRALRPLSFVLVTALATLWACGTEDTADRVHDLRMLAIRAEPPEQLIALSFGPPRGGGGLDAGAPRDAGAPGPSDGGFAGFDAGPLAFPDGGFDVCAILGLLSDGGIHLPPGFDAGDVSQLDAGCALPGDGGGLPFSPFKPVTVTALIADPQGAGRPIHYKFEVCPHLDTNERCDPASAEYANFAEGDLTVTGVSNEISATFTPSLALITQAIQQDAFKGFGGLPLPVVLTVTAGSEKVIGNKLVVFTAPFGTKPIVPNTNPEIEGVLADDAGWTADAPPTFTPKEATSTTTGGGGAKLTGGIDVLPLFDAGTQEKYFRYTFSGQEVDLQEAFRFNFFATAGTFNPFGTGGLNVRAITNGSTEPPPYDTLWFADQGQATQDVTYWIVVRDGRGGENWIVRQAHFQP
jgi:hypothetical protein